MARLTTWYGQYLGTDIDRDRRKSCQRGVIGLNAGLEKQNNGIYLEGWDTSSILCAF